MKISIKPLDKLFSFYIRSRDGWKCQRCEKQYQPPTNGLHCAHIFTRGAKSTRFDPENAVAWCYGCHSYMDSHPIEKYDWYIERFGRTQFEILRFKAKKPRKPDYVMIKLWLKEKLKDLNEQPI